MREFVYQMPVKVYFGENGVEKHLSDEQAALKGIEALEQLIRDGGLGSTWGELGYDLTEEVAKAVSQTCKVSVNSVRQLPREEIYHILMECR